MFGAIGAAVAKWRLAKARVVVQFVFLVFLLSVVCVIGRLGDLREQQPSQSENLSEGDRDFFLLRKSGNPGVYENTSCFTVCPNLTKSGNPGEYGFFRSFALCPPGFPLLVFSIAPLINHTFPAHGIGFASDCQGTWGRPHAH